MAGLLAAACTPDTADLGGERVSTSTAAVSTTAESTTAPPTTEPPVRSFTTAFSGDVLIHTPVWNKARKYAGGQGYDFVPMFQDIAPLVSSVDLAVCHMETPIAPPGEEPQTYPRYGVPKEIVPAIAAGGYDRCSTASNHSLDRGSRFRNSRP